MHPSPGYNVVLPGQTLRARLTGDEREREGGSADSEQDSVIQWNVYYVMTTLNLNCACDPCVTSYYRISTESHDCCNLIGSANIPAEPTETCSESADPLSLSLSSPLAHPLVFRSSPVKRARRVCPWILYIHILGKMYTSNTCTLTYHLYSLRLAPTMSCIFSSIYTSEMHDIVGASLSE